MIWSRTTDPGHANPDHPADTGRDATRTVDLPIPVAPEPGLTEATALTRPMTSPTAGTATIPLIGVDPTIGPVPGNCRAGPRGSRAAGAGHAARCGRLSEPPGVSTPRGADQRPACAPGGFALHRCSGGGPHPPASIVESSGSGTSGG